MGVRARVRSVDTLGCFWSDLVKGNPNSRFKGGFLGKRDSRKESNLIGSTIVVLGLYISKFKSFITRKWAYYCKT